MNENTKHRGKTFCFLGRPGVPTILGRNSLIILIWIGILIGFLPILGLKPQEIEAEVNIGEISENFGDELGIIQGNSLLSITEPANPEPEVIKRLLVIVTGYSSTEDQTDSDPFITAAGTWVREGIIASNLLPFGTKVRIPEVYGDKIFVVEDRMHWEKKYQIDIWFPSYWEALNFGAKRTYIEILKG